MTFWYINRYKFEKRWVNAFQIYPNAIHFNPLQFCPSMSLLGFPVFSLSSPIVLSCFCYILVNSMTMWSVLKSPKIVWPSTLKFKIDTMNCWLHYFNLLFNGYLTASSIKAVTYKFQLPHKSHLCRKLNNMEQTFVLQTPYMKETRSGKMEQWVLSDWP